MDGRILELYLLTKVWEPPDVSQSNWISDDAQEELHFAGPSSTFRIISTGCTQRTDRAALRWRQDDGYTMTVPSSSGVQRCHFMTIVSIPQNTSADYHPSSFRVHLACIWIACHDWIQLIDVSAFEWILTPSNCSSLSWKSGKFRYVNSWKRHMSSWWAESRFVCWMSFF